MLNVHVRNVRQKLANNADRLAKWVDTTVEEIKAFLGLAIMMGINSLPQLAMYWSENPFIGTMPESSQ